MNGYPRRWLATVRAGLKGVGGVEDILAISYGILSHLYNDTKEGSKSPGTQTPSSPIAPSLLYRSQFRDFEQKTEELLTVL